MKPESDTVAVSIRHSDERSDARKFFGRYKTLELDALVSVFKEKGIYSEKLGDFFSGSDIDSQFSIDDNGSCIFEIVVDVDAIL